MQEKLLKATIQYNRRIIDNNITNLKYVLRKTFSSKTDQELMANTIISSICAINCEALDNAIKKINEGNIELGKNPYDLLKSCIDEVRDQDAITKASL